MCYYEPVAKRRRSYGRVVELVDSLDSGSSVHCGRAGSSPASPTKIDKFRKKLVDFYLLLLHNSLFTKTRYRFWESNYSEKLLHDLRINSP